MLSNRLAPELTPIICAEFAQQKEYERANRGADRQKFQSASRACISAVAVHGRGGTVLFISMKQLDEVGQLFLHCQASMTAKTCAAFCRATTLTRWPLISSISMSTLRNCYKYDNEAPERVIELVHEQPFIEGAKLNAAFTLENATLAPPSRRHVVSGAEQELWHARSARRALV